MKSIMFDVCGDPEEVLHIRDRPTPEPGPGQVRVRMIASPINPSDLLTIQGRYSSQPQLPCTPGYEGVGMVEKNGGGLLGWRVLGRRVAVLNTNGGNWQEQVIIPARQAVPIPNGISDEQAAAFFVNPASAVAMTRYVLKVPAGAWLLQTAAGSALGRMVIRLGKYYGFRTINVVRRREQANELLQMGGDATICTSDESIANRVNTLTNGQGVAYAMDAVGGKTAAEVAQALSENGRLLLYGTLSEEPLSIHPRVLMAGQKKIEGFWMSKWARAHGPLTMLALFRRVGKLMQTGILTSEIGATFPMQDIKAAVREASQPGHKGKVLIRFA